VSHSPAVSRAPKSSDEALITTTRAEGAVVVTVACESLRERQAGELRDRLECIAEGAEFRVAVCLAGVSMICSTCLTDLTLMHQRCRAKGGALVVFNLKSSLREMLESTGLFKALPLADNLPEAIGLCRRGPERQSLYDRFRRSRAA
jgi:anti-anti-sigma factor